VQFASEVDFGANNPGTIVGSGNGYVLVTSPPGALGTVDVTVTSIGGTVTDSSAYTYLPPPTVSGLTGTFGPLKGGTPVTITGTGLANATEVDFVEDINGTYSGNPATIIGDTGTQIVVTSPSSFNGDAGPFDVTVTTPNGTSAITEPADQFTYVAPPTINSTDTSAGPVTGSTRVTITGTGLANATAVTFGSNPATIVNGSNTDTQIVVMSPAASGDVPGPVDLTVTTAFGAATDYSAFTYDLPPVVTSISQSSGPVAGGTTLTISGVNLSGATAVDFGGVAAASFYNGGDATIYATIPAGAASTVDVTVVTPGGGTSITSPADQYTYLPPPSVTGVSPSVGPIAGGTLVTISGFGLGGASSVDFIDGSSDDFHATIQSDSNNQLVVISPNVGFTDTVDITVTAAADTSPASAADLFTYVTLPEVTGLSLTSGLRSGGDAVTISGANLAGATSVAFGSIPAQFTINPDNTITAISPPQSDGVVDVTVATDGIASTPSAQDQFTYLQPTPAVTGVSPSVGAAAGNETVTITGTDLDGAIEVDFGGVAGTIVPSSDTATQIMATVPSGTLGTVDVTVTTPGGPSAVSQADQFTGIAAPAVTSIDPSAGPAAGGTDVIIYGSYLDGATAVKFGRTAGTIVVDTASYLIATSPAGSGGIVDITVTTPEGTSAASTADKFTFVAAPTAQPDSYTVAQNSHLTVSAPGVLANDTAPQGYALTATLLTEPANGTLSWGGDGSFIYTPNSGYVGADSFTYEATDAYGNSSPTTVTLRSASLPTVTGVTPALGPLAGGTTVTITGTGFIAGTTTVDFGPNNPATNVSVNAAGTQITATNPAGAGTVDVTVTTSDGTSTAIAADQFAYTGQNVIADFGSSHGFWSWQNDTSWKALNANSPVWTVPGNFYGKGDTDLLVNFGGSLGLWIYNSNTTTWQFLHSGNPVRAVVADVSGDGIDEIVVDFGAGGGIWQYDAPTAVWTPVNGGTSKAMLAASVDGNGVQDVVIDFANSGGLWIWKGGATWEPINAADPVTMQAVALYGKGKQDLVVDFGATAHLWAYVNDTSWQPLSAVSPVWTVPGNFDSSGDTDLLVNFGGSLGLWIYDSSTTTWQYLHAGDPVRAVCADVTGNGIDEAVIDFGAGGGIWEYSVPAATWTPVNGGTSNAMVVADVDANGMQDVVIAFADSGGLWIWKNGVWEAINASDPVAMTVLQSDSAA
jgi:hypothetical protein